MIFRFDLKIFAFLLLFLITNQIKEYCIVMLFAIIHECGHLLAGVLLGMKPSKLEIMPFGVSISFNVKLKDFYNKILNGNVLEIKKVIVAISGPMVNLLLILIINHFDINYEMKMFMIYSNLILFLFNILPIYPLDGGRVLKSILYIFAGEIIAEKCTKIISLITVVIITIFSCVLVFYLKNFALILIVIFLWGLQN